MSALQQDVVTQFESLEPDGQAAELAVLLERVKPDAAQQVGQRASGQAREALFAILAGVPDRPRNAVSIVAISILGGLTAVGMGLGAATVLSGSESMPFFGFAGAALGILGGILVPMPVSLTRLRRRV
jgi:hypothetical protein